MAERISAYCEECCFVVEVNIDNGAYIQTQQGQQELSCRDFKAIKLPINQTWHVESCNNHLPLVHTITPHGDSERVGVFAEDDWHE